MQTQKLGGHIKKTRHLMPFVSMPSRLCRRGENTAIQRLNNQPVTIYHWVQAQQSQECSLQRHNERCKERERAKDKERERKRERERESTWSSDPLQRGPRPVGQTQSQMQSPVRSSGAGRRGVWRPQSHSVSGVKPWTAFNWPERGQERNDRVAKECKKSDRWRERE